MKDVLSYDDFVFFDVKFKDYHYTDNRAGAPKNYLAYMKKGSVKIVSQSETIFAEEGDVFYIPKNLRYQSYWYGNDEIEFLSFGFNSLNINENDKFILQKIECDKKTIDKILKIPTKGNAIDCRTLSAFYDVMSDIIPKLKYASGNNGELMVVKIKKYILDNLNCSMTEISKMCGMSEPYIYSLFKKYADTTPNDYKQKILCEKGIELLLTTNKKIEEISEIMGFSSSSYFRKVLMKHTGKTPREIRKFRGV